MIFVIKEKEEGGIMFINPNEGGESGSLIPADFSFIDIIIVQFLRPPSLFLLHLPYSGK